MRLTVAKGNMYPWCDYTANPLAGKCPHSCKYCYMRDLKKFSQVKEKYSGRLRVSRSDLNTPTGKHKVRRKVNVPSVPDNTPIIFLCSGSDLGAAPTNIQIEILEDCRDYPDYCYLIQSKNPAGLMEVEDYFPPRVILGTTAESHSASLCKTVSNAPSPLHRLNALEDFDGDYLKMVSVEPVLERYPFILSELIRRVNPDFVSIGADRDGRHNLPEPDWDTVLDLISRLERFTVVLRKKNLEGLKNRGGEN